MKQISSLFVAVILLLSLCACTQSAEERWQEQYDLGVRYLSEGDYEEAIIAFTAAIEIDPKRADGYIGLADVYVALDDIEKAIEVLEFAINNVGPRDIIQNKIDEISHRDPIIISSVTYDRELVGDINGTPATISVQYSCPDEETYFLSLGLIKDDEYVCRFRPDDLSASYWAVNGSGSIDVETRLLLFETSADSFQISAGMLKLDSHSAYEKVYSTIFRASYSINENFVGISIPDVPQYPEQAYSGGEIILPNLTLTGTIKKTSEIYQGYLDCVEQYGSYTSYESRGSASADVLQLDRPITLSDGTQIECTSIAFSSEFVEEFDIRTFIENSLNQAVTISGYLEKQPQGMSGIVLVSGFTNPDDFWYQFELPYTFVIQSVQS